MTHVGAHRRLPAVPSGDEPSTRSLTERLQDTLSNAAEEHRANAGPACSRAAAAYVVRPGASRVGPGCG